MRNALSVDVEEYFHPTEVQRSVSPSQWASLPSRVEEQTLRVLDLLERHRVKATFFLLGWVAARHPKVGRWVTESGHQVACHGYAHQLVYEQTPAQFREDIRMARIAIEDCCGVQPTAYRAPSYSITGKCLWALEVLIEQGFTLDSSVYPISHDRYGLAELGRRPTWITTPSGRIFEVPIATARLPGGRIAPVGGGAYLRLVPYCYTAAGLRRLNEAEESPGCVYFHTWELDPHQPRIASGMIARMRTYRGLGAMGRKVERLLEDFEFSTLSDLYPLAVRPQGEALLTAPLRA